MVDFFELLRRLAEAKVDFVLVGGLAAAAHGSSLVTQDVDVCIRLGSENLGRLHDALKDLAPAHRMVHPAIPFEHDAPTLASFRNVYLKTTIGQLDCIGEVLGVGNFAAVYEKSVEIDLNGSPCRVISIDALIIAKEAMNRDRDRLAAEQLRRIRSLQQPPSTR